MLTPCAHFWVRFLLTFLFVFLYHYQYLLLHTASTPTCAIIAQQYLIITSSGLKFVLVNEFSPLPFRYKLEIVGGMGPTVGKVKYSWFSIYIYVLFCFFLFYTVQIRYKMSVQHKIDNYKLLTDNLRCIH